MVNCIKGFLQIHEDSHMILSFCVCVDVVQEVYDAVYCLMVLTEPELVSCEDVFLSVAVELVVGYFLVDFAEYREERDRPVV